MDEKEKLNRLITKIVIIQLVLQLAILPLTFLTDKIYYSFDFLRSFDYFIFIYLSPFVILLIVSMLIPAFVRYKLKRNLTGSIFITLTVLPIFTTIAMIIIAFMIIWASTGFSMM
jgi:hypothetical protein